LKVLDSTSNGQPGTRNGRLPPMCDPGLSANDA
jgi:hypothetical protein